MRDLDRFLSRRSLLKAMGWAPLVLRAAALHGSAGLFGISGVDLTASPLFDARFRPHYPAKSPLEDVLRLVAPGSDEFVTEAYASEIGKGRGVPTIYFTGQGTDGGHAWFGYLSRSGKWELDCGRYASQNYPKGYALDPQTWQVVNDTTLQDLAKNGGSNPWLCP